MAKKLFVLISNGGDGSYYPHYTMNQALIDKLHEAYTRDLMDYENGIGVDGDGFHYQVLMVPDECTPESLGQSMLDDDYADSFFEDEGDDE